MNRPVHIFLGPTLPAEEAARICPAQYHPPVRMGDVFALLPERPRIIGIVDGLFHCTPAVWHKEILAALSQGVIVVGAASMGALRAAELAQLGMVGVGRIFEQLQAGQIEDDDAVAVLHGGREDRYRPLSDALVNLEHGLTLAAGGGAISEATCRQLLAQARETHYAQRSWQALLAACAPDEREGLAAFLEREKPNLKRDDAVQLLEWVRVRAADGAPGAVRGDFEQTMTFSVAMERLMKRRQAEAVLPMPTAGVDESWEPRLFDWLVIAEAQRLGVAITQAEFALEYAAFLREQGCTENPESWARARGVTEGVVQHHVAIQALKRRMLAHHAPQLASLAALARLRDSLK